jgi:FdhE protein
VSRASGLPRDVGQRLEIVARSLPEWASWFALVEAAVREASVHAWDAAELSLHPSRPLNAPLLSGAVLPIDGGRAEQWIGTLLERARARPGPTAPEGRDMLDHRAYLEAAACQDADRIAALGVGAGMGGDRLIALGGLATMPLLHACRRSLDMTVPQDWTQGYCPLCGGWPALAEIRGLERERHLRCARCGAGWRIDWLRCPFCGQGHHTRFEALVSEAHGETRKVEACLSCRGYVKTLTSLRPWPPDQVLIEDAATIDLDVAALGQGFARPDRPAVDLGMRLLPGGATGRTTLSRLILRILWSGR